MLLQNIKISNFRNFSFLDIDLHDVGTIFLLGENGQGKTNFLEAIYCMCFGASFRKQKDEFLVKHGEREFGLRGVFLSSEKIEHELLIEYAETKKKIIYDNTQIKDRREILDNYPCIVFKHGDFSLLTGAAEAQRLFLDQSLSLCFFHYLDVLKTYNRCLRQKNKALKQKIVDRNILFVYNNILSETGKQIIQYRETFVDFINERIVRLFKKIVNNDLEVRLDYISVWKKKSKEDIVTKLNNNMDLEVKATFCLSGPHRDKIVSYLEGFPLRQTVSTGQIRLLSLLLRTIQSEYYVLHKNKLPTYLFDDVLLEIDNTKQLRFLDELPKTNQAFFTFLPSESIPHIISQNSRTFLVHKGTLKET